VFGASKAFGKDIELYYNLKGVKTVLSLDSDFLTSMPGSVRYALDFAESRRVRKDTTSMSRLYAIESAYSVTGAAADHRLAVRPSALETVAAGIAALVSGGTATGLTAEETTFAEAVVADLKAGHGVVVPGDHSSDAVHHYAAVINSAIGALGTHVLASKPVIADKQGSLSDVVQALDNGSVKTLVIIGGNPVYNAPSDVNFGKALGKFTGNRENDAIRISLYEDETSILCNWHLPLSHELESWGDAVAYDGTVSLSQPLIKPLYSTKSEIEYLSEFLGQPISGEQLVKETYGGITDAAWGQALARGIIRQAPAPIAFPQLSAAPQPKARNASGYEVQFRLDPTIHDGRYANNAWLQELPKPVTTLVWDNAAMVSAATAKKLGIIPQVGESDAVNIAQYTGRKMVELAVDGETLKVAVWILPGQPDETITLALGYGRTHGGEAAKGRGFNTYKLRTTKNLYMASAEAKTIAEEYDLVFTQPHHLLKAEYVETKNRDIVRVATFDEYVEKKGEIFEELHHGVARALDKPHDAHESHSGEGKSYPADPGGNFRYAERSLANKEDWPSLYPEFSNVGYNQWAMTIDLTTCIGCNACSIACQAENNIPVVGKKEVARGREMHWIRLDHYYEGTDVNDPISHFMPVPCMQCEKAPCEPVCPVAATIHSHEGLNQMVYNRCVGTRYCSNNCPYKVRRFNFLKWTQGVGGPGTLDYYNKPQLKMLANPRVSVRGRGVMEKCTYCVQRINEVRIEAKKDGREIEDQQVRTACQQACPTQAIEFGDMMDPTSRVSVNKAQPHDYALLSDLNTRPRTTYLARIRNTNSKLEKA
jgi:molybdopterin-containing oxidoreductase family iron-sulfur binding subunit